MPRMPRSLKQPVWWMTLAASLSTAQRTARGAVGRLFTISFLAPSKAMRFYRTTIVALELLECTVPLAWGKCNGQVGLARVTAPGDHHSFERAGF